MTVHKTQILILGAGISGCIAALALAPCYEVLLVDQQTEPQARVGECLAAAAGRILQKLGLSELLTQGHLGAHGLLSYWGTDTPVVVDPMANPDGHGWHLDRSLFERQLRGAALRRGIACLWPASFSYCEKQQNGWLVDVQQDDALTQVHCQVVIDATGRHSRFARAQGASRQHIDQQLSIWLTAGVTVRKQISVLSSTPTGWWYSAPLPALPDQQSLAPADQARLFALQVQPGQFNKELSQSSTAFLQAAAGAPGLSTLVQQLVAGTEKLHGVVAANSSKLTPACGDAWFAIGDAALSFDPLSSQGIFNAMATAMQLADLLKEQGLQHNETAALYQAQLDSIWQQYLAHKQQYYAVV